MSAYLTDADIAEKFGESVEKIAKWRRQHGWPHMKVGRQVRYTDSDLVEIERLHHIAVTKSSTASTGQTALSAARAS